MKRYNNALKAVERSDGSYQMFGFRNALASLDRSLNGIAINQNIKFKTARADGRGVFSKSKNVFAIASAKRWTSRRI